MPLGNSGSEFDSGPEHVYDCFGVFKHIFLNFPQYHDIRENLVESYECEIFTIELLVKIFS